MTQIGLRARITARLGTSGSSKQHAFDVIAVVDAVGVVEYVSPSAGQVLGRPPHACVGVTGVVVNLRDVTECKQAELELSRLALHDPLTGLPNRVRLLERIASVLDGGQSDSAVLFCDLDGSKAVSGRHGHDLGDRLLIVAADRAMYCAKRLPAGVAMHHWDDAIDPTGEHPDVARR